MDVKLYLGYECLAAFQALREDGKTFWEGSEAGWGS